MNNSFLQKSTFYWMMSMTLLHPELPCFHPMTPALTLILALQLKVKWQGQMRTKKMNLMDQCIMGKQRMKYLRPLPLQAIAPTSRPFQTTFLEVENVLSCFIASVRNASCEKKPPNLGFRLPPPRKILDPPLVYSCPHAQGHVLNHPAQTHRQLDKAMHKSPPCSSTKGLKILRKVSGKACTCGEWNVFINNLYVCRES